MMEADRFRKQAKVCWEEADKARSSVDAASWRQLADDFEKLAGDFERLAGGDPRVLSKGGPPSLVAPGSETGKSR